MDTIISMWLELIRSRYTVARAKESVVEPEPPKPHNFIGGMSESMLRRMQRIARERYEALLKEEVIPPKKWPQS